MTRRVCLAGLGLLAVSRATVRNVKDRVHQGINAQRRRHGVPPLVWNAALAGTARQHSERMLLAGFFAHQDPERGDLIQRLSAAAIPWKAIAENIFREQGYDDPVSRAIVEWMYSAGHRVNLLGPAFTKPESASPSRVTRNTTSRNSSCAARGNKRRGSAQAAGNTPANVGQNRSGPSAGVAPREAAPR